MQAARAVYDKTPWLTEVFEKDYKQKLLGLHGWDNYHLGTTDPWDTVADLKGVKVGGAGPNLPWLEYAGAVPVQSTLPDGYLSLQTGVYNGWLMFPSAYLGFKFHEPLLALNYELRKASLRKIHADIYMAMAYQSLMKWLHLNLIYIVTLLALVFIAPMALAHTGKPMSVRSCTSRTPASMIKPRQPRACADVANRSPK